MRKFHQVWAVQKYHQYDLGPLLHCGNVYDMRNLSVTKKLHFRGFLYPLILIARFNDVFHPLFLCANLKNWLISFTCWTAHFLIVISDLNIYFKAVLKSDTLIHLQSSFLEIEKENWVTIGRASFFKEENKLYKCTPFKETLFCLIFKHSVVELMARAVLTDMRLNSGVALLLKQVSKLI